MKDPKNKNSPTVVWIICNLNELKICTCETNTYFIHCQVGFKRSGNEREKVIVAFGNWYLICSATYNFFFFIPTSFKANLTMNEVFFSQVPLRRLKVAILTFSLMYLDNNVHAATSGIQLPLPLKPARSSNLFIYRLEEVAGFKKKNCHFL